MPLHPQSQFIINFIDSLGDKPFEEDTPQNARDIRNARTTPSTLPIFETKDIQGGWNGTYNGVAVQSGTYTWKVTYKDLEGFDYQAAGHINVLR